ncbi:MAG: glycosyltransferase family 2 protein, partial [Pseudomonadota bacterium]
MGALGSYKLRLQRKRWIARGIRKRRELRNVVNRTKDIRKGDIIVFSTQRNEKIRLSYFLEYYRNLGANHFIIVDNDSDDGSVPYLAAQPDVSVWHTKASYKRSRFGVDWLNYLQWKYAHGHWILVVDPDEFLVYPFCDTRPLRALTDWLDASSIRSFGAMLLEMYPKGRIDSVPYREGQDPVEIANWFDAGNYSIQKNERFGNLWIQGGPRSRKFFPDEPARAPALNKTPLVKWHRSYAYVSSTHMLL